MSETCYVTEVRLLTALEPLAPRAVVAKAAQVASKARFSLASIPWPFLPQVPYTTAASQKETTCVNNNNLRQRRLVSASAVAAAAVASAVTPQKIQSKPVALVAPSAPSWPTLVLLVLEGLRFTVAKSLLGAAVGSALAVLVCEVVTVLASLAMANKVPPGLLFMVAALGVLGYVASKAICQDTASVRRRKSSMALLKK